jgi:hypothetical protein
VVILGFSQAQQPHAFDVWAVVIDYKHARDQAQRYEYLWRENPDRENLCMSQRYCHFAEIEGERLRGLLVACEPAGSA